MRAIIIPPGYYLVGRHDGNVEEFFAWIVKDDEGRIFIGANVPTHVMKEAIARLGDWWWQKADFPPVPNNWDNYPPSIKELP